ncbi:MAG: hypothetical protein WKF47_14195 [Geodermatophilaceae bacterium]
MAMASYGRPAFLAELREAVHTTGDGGFRTEPDRLGQPGQATRQG